MKFKVLFSVVMLVVFVTGSSEANLPAPLSEDDYRLANFLNGVERIYVYPDGNTGFFYEHDAFAELELADVMGKTLEIADIQMEAKFPEALMSLTNINNGNVFYSRPDNPDQLENALVIAYDRSLSKSVVGEEEGLLGAMVLSVRIYPSKTCKLDDSCVEERAFDMPAVPFIVADDLDFEYTEAGELMMDTLHPSYVAAIGKAVARLQRLFDHYAKIHLDHMGKKQ